MNYFKLRKEISLGEILTFASIIGSTISIILSWSFDRKIKLRENADKIRIEAANTAGKVQRTTEIYLSFYEKIQSDIVEVSELYAKTKSNISARDFLWKRLQLRQSEIHERILDEQLETAFINLLPFDPGIDSLYNSSLQRLRKLNDKQFTLLMIDLEAFVAAYQSKTPEQSALMGNDLRDRITFYKKNHLEQLSHGIMDLETHLKILINSPNSVLLK